MRKLNNNSAIAIGVLGILILAIIAIIFFVAIVAFWGVLGLIGLILICLGFFYEWKTGMGMNPFTLGMILVGLIFVFISAYDIGGLEFMKFANPLQGVL